MNNLANKTRFQLSTGFCRKLLFILFWFSYFSGSAQYYVDSICTNVDVSIFDEVHIDSIAASNFNFEGHADTICYADVSSEGECTWNDFKGHFDISQWWFKADNHDGDIHIEGLPYSIALEGAKHSPRNNYRRYIASLKTIVPTSGYVAFDWESYGGSFYSIDAFYFTVNDSCVQLTRTDKTSGRFVSWYIAAGDTVSLEQTSNGTSNHITTSISNFQFIPREYKIIDRTWKVVDHYADTTRCVQRITVLRPGLDEFVIPANLDGYDQDYLACDDRGIPNSIDYPFYVGLRDTHYLSATPSWDYSASYVDKSISSCGGNKTVNRKWTIKDHCSGASITKSQIIKKKDLGPIEMKCPADQTFKISKCSVSVYIRTPRAWTSCNENIHVDINWAYGSGSKVYSNVAPGRYEITFTAKDGCGLERTCLMWLNLVYNGMEAVACKDDQYLSLPESGHLNIPISELVERNSSSCSGDLRFEIEGSEYLNLSCSDIGWKTYTIRYFDPSTPNDYKTCNIGVELSGSLVTVNCKNDQYYTLPASGQLNISVSDLVERNNSTCSGDLRFEIAGSEYLNLDCSNIGWKTYTIRYFDPVTPNDYKTCSIDIELGGSMETVNCKGDQYYALPESGQLNIPVSELIERNSSSCSGDLRFEIDGSEYLNLDCSNIGWKTYTIRYFYLTNPSDYQTCSIDIELSGTTGIITCPDDRTISCNDDLSNLNIYGVPSVSGVAESSIVYSEDRQLNDCGIGYIIRTWSITTICSGDKTCNQRINVDGSIGNIIIEWPSDYITDGCSGDVDLNPTALPTGYDMPRSSTSDACGSISYMYIDSEASGSQDCYVILRKWTATNSCDPYWSDTYTQSLEVRDSDKPVINAPSDQNVFNNSALCEGSYVSLLGAIVTDCDPAITVTHNSPYANSTGANASGTYPVGETIVTFTAIDKCGNRETATTAIEVTSNGDPTLTCIGELEINLNLDSYGNASYNLQADQLVTSSGNSCNGDGYIYAFSENVSDTKIGITCGDIGLKGIQVYRFNGTTWAYCQAWVSVKDPSAYCNTGAVVASVSGSITMADGQAVKYVNIELEGMEDVNSDDDGNYMVENIPTGNRYVIAPVKEINYRNGISTLDMVMLNRHLLGIKSIASPYQLIACDINNNQSISVGDLFKMNGLVLGTISDLEQSWKFVRSDYVFPDPTNPFLEEVPEYIDINLQEDMINLDFIAIKVGDANYSANPRRIDGFEQTATSLFLDTEVNQLEEGVIEVTITPPSQMIMEGMQFTLEFDPSTMRYIDVVSAFGLDPNLVINHSMAHQGKLGIVFLNYYQKDILEPLQLTFHSLTTVDGSKTIIKQSNAIYKSEGYLGSNIHPLELRYSSATTEPLNFTVAPNPFTDVTRLDIKSDKDQDIDLSIIDLSGKLVSIRNTRLNKGTNIYTLQRTDFENAGIYVIKLSNSSISRWTKIVLID